jgi:hypothetical protein
MAGHHAPHTLVIIDEASGVDDAVYHYVDTWAKRKLLTAAQRSKLLCSQGQACRCKE